MYKKLKCWLSEQLFSKEIIIQIDKTTFRIVNERSLIQEHDLLQMLCTKTDALEFGLQKWQKYLMHYFTFLSAKLQFDSNTEKLKILSKVVASEHLELLLITPRLTDVILNDKTGKIAPQLSQWYQHLKSQKWTNFTLLTLAFDPSIIQCMLKSDQFIKKLMALDMHGYATLQIVNQRELFCRNELTAEEANKFGIPAPQPREVDILTIPRIPHVNITFFDPDWEDEVAQSSVANRTQNSL